MKISNKKIKKLIYEALKRNLMEMPLRNITFAQKGEKGFNFSSDMPKDAESLYNKQLLKDIKSTQYIKDYFSNSIIDVDIIVLPENIFKTTINPDLLIHYHSKLIGIFDTAAVRALIDGKYKKYKQVISNVRSDALTLILQTHPLAGKKDIGDALQLGEYSLDWGLHDTAGHVIQNKDQLYDAIIGLLDLPFSVISQISGKDYSPFSGGSNKLKRLTGAGDFIQKIEGPSIGTGSQPRFGEEEMKDLKMSFRKDLLKFFKEKNFTPQVGYEDSHASICGYYFVYRKLPAPFTDAKYNPILFTDDELGDFKQQADKAFRDELVGMTAVLNFIEREPHVSATGISAIKDKGF